MTMDGCCVSSQKCIYVYCVYAHIPYIYGDVAFNMEKKLRHIDWLNEWECDFLVHRNVGVNNDNNNNKIWWMPFAYIEVWM